MEKEMERISFPEGIVLYSSQLVSSSHLEKDFEELEKEKSVTLFPTFFLSLPIFPMAQGSRSFGMTCQQLVIHLT